MKEKKYYYFISKERRIKFLNQTNKKITKKNPSTIKQIQNRIVSQHYNLQNENKKGKQILTPKYIDV